MSPVAPSLVIFLLVQMHYHLSLGSPISEGSPFGGEFNDLEMANAVPRLGRRSPRPFRFSPSIPALQGGPMEDNIYTSGFRFRNNGGELPGSYLSKRDGGNPIANSQGAKNGSPSYLRRLPKILSGKFDSSKASLNVVQDYYWTKLLDDVAKNAFNAKLAKLKSMAKEVEKESSSPDSVFRAKEIDSATPNKFGKSWSSFE